MSTAVECLRLALAEERGRLIVAMYEMPMTDLEQLVEAAQLIAVQWLRDGLGILDERDHAGEVCA